MSDATDTLLVEIRASLEAFTSKMVEAANVTTESSAKMEGSIAGVESAVRQMTAQVTALLEEQIISVDLLSMRMQDGFRKAGRAARTESEEIKASMGGIGGAMSSLGGLIAAYLGYDAVKHIVDANIDFQQMFYTLEAGTGSARGAGEMLNWLTHVSMALGINLRTAGQQFGMMLAAAQGQNISVQSIQGLYLGLAKTFDIMHSKTYAQQRAMYAFNEMISMGTVRTRQFQMMLQRDMPGVPWLKIASDALGVTEKQFEKLLKSGQITASELIPKMAAGLNSWADHSSALAGAVSGLNATFNRFRTALFGVAKNAGGLFITALTNALDQITKIIQVLDPLNTKIKETGGKFIWLRDTINVVVQIFEELKLVVQVVFTFIFAIIRSAVDMIVATFRTLVEAAAIVAHAFDLLMGVVANFVENTRRGMSGIGTAIKDAFTGHLVNAKNAIGATGEAFKSAFTGGEVLHQGLQRIGNDFSNIGSIGKNALTNLKTNFAAAASEISDSWSKVSDNVSNVWDVAPTPNAIPGMPAGAGTSHASSTGMSEGDKKNVIAQLQTQLQAAQKASLARLQIARQEVAESKILFGEKSTEYQDALRRMNTAQQQYEAQQKQLDELDVEQAKQSALARVASKRQELDQLRALGQISAAEETRGLIKLEDEKYKIELAALDKKLALNEKDKLDTKRTQLAIDALEQQHALRVQKLNNQMVRDVQQHWLQIFSAVTNAVDQSVKGLIRGTTTWHNAARNIFQSILAEFIDMGVKMVAHWLATQIAMTGATVAGATARTAVEEAANKKSLLSTAATVTKQILMRMWAVMTEVYSAIAGIPYVGPFLAPAMAIAAGALIASWAGRVASAAGGWANVPEDQMAMVHKNEMILPAPLAEGVRNMIGQGGAGGGATHNWHIHAVDAAGVKRFFLDNQDALAAALSRASRNGVFMAP